MVFKDKDSGDVERKSLEANNLPFIYPYWFTTSDLETIEESVIQIIVHDDFMTLHPNVNLFLQYNANDLANYKGDTIGKEVNKTMLYYEGADVLGKNVNADGLSNNTEVLSGYDLDGFLQDEYDTRYYHVMANFTSRINLICIFHLDSIATTYKGVCTTNDDREPDIIDIALDQTSLNPYKDYIYIVSVSEDNNCIKIANGVPTDEDGGFNYGRVISTNDLDTISVVATDEAEKITTTNLYSHSFSGIYNSGNHYGLYTRDLTAEELSMFPVMNFDATKVNVVSNWGNNGIESKAICTDDKDKYLRYINK